MTKAFVLTLKMFGAILAVIVLAVLVVPTLGHSGNWLQKPLEFVMR